jgi:starch-binding outer membrane protein, SusD/RagB family
MNSHATYTRVCSLLCALLLTVASCKKLVDVDPPITSYTSESVFNEVGTAIGVLNDLYSRLGGESFQGNGLSAVNISIKAGLSADELNLWSGADQEGKAFYQNNLISNPVSGARGQVFWSKGYSFIYKCNAAIEGLNTTNNLPENIKIQLLGEAYFMRAFYHLYITAFYGDAAIVATTDYKVNTTVSRSSQADVYQFIVDDLKKAQELLSYKYLNGKLQPLSSPTQRLRPTYWAATALIARTYLYAGDYASAEREASTIINESGLFSLTPSVKINTTFNNGNNQEAIWQLQPVASDGILPWNTEEGKTFVLSAAPKGVNFNHPVYLSNFLLTAFENGDLRRLNWVGTYTDGVGTFYFPNKYKVGTTSNPVTEFSMALRLAEVFLIRAEARAHLGNLAGSVADLNVIRERSGLTAYGGSNSQVALLSAILHERQVELFSEWGHRWIDLRRFKAIDSVMAIVTPTKASGAAWKSHQQWYPLPFDDIDRNPQLVQNQGYY